MKPRCATISNSAPRAFPSPRSASTAPFRAARRSVPISTRAISTAIGSGMCGKTASNPSATASGRGAANAPPARCSAIASAAVCTCTATTAGCSIATITGFDAYPFLKKGPPSVGGCFFLGCPFPCRLLPRRFRSQLFRSRLLFLGCPSLVGSSSGLGSSFLVGSDLSYSDFDGSSSDVLSSAAFTRGIAGAPVPVSVYSGRTPSNASPSSNSLVL